MIKDKKTKFKIRVFALNTPVKIQANVTFKEKRRFIAMNLTFLSPAIMTTADIYMNIAVT